MEDQNLVGKKFGKWTIIEECTKLYRRCKMVICRCECGTEKPARRSPFIHGGYSEQCFKCHLKKQKSMPMAGPKRGE